MRKDRYAQLNRIRSLDPERDYVEIYRTMVRYEFPWDLKLGLNLAFNRSFSLPSIAAVHTQTGELLHHTQKRIDDTGLLMYEMILNGFEHPRGRASLRRVNQLHRPYDIPNEDYLYVLGCLVVIPLRWLERYGWRQPCCHERRATFVFYRELGKRMNISDIPDSYEALEAWFDAYDAEHLRPNDEAAAIERATRMLMKSRVPRALSRVSDALVIAMYDDRLRHAVQVPSPPWLIRAGLHLALKARAFVLRHFAAPRKTAMFADGIRTKTYPNGYDINALGPAHSPRESATDSGTR
ncbi:MAG TPA: oxygenase MpaB family protein [Micromonospora sp.]